MDGNRPEMERSTCYGGFQLKCDICHIDFSTRKGLISHKKSHENERFRQCQTCAKTFRDSYALNQHVTRVHENKEVQCHLCDSKLRENDLSTHYEEQHRTCLEKEFHSFSTMDEFEEWKEKMETETKSKYVQHRGARINRDGTSVLYLYCHRDGYCHPKGKNIRSIKLLGSNKINSHCPSNITVKQKTDVSVEFIKTHFGHSAELGRLTLTKKEKDDIATKIAMKIPLESILDDIRDSIHENEVCRVHLTKKKDLFNIIEQYQLNKDSVYHTNDYTSVDSWIKHMQSTSNIIRLYKPQGKILDSCPQLQTGDFCLIIANDAQFSLLEKFGNDVLCIDGTHGLNSCDFELYTLLVLDDLREGFPCSFMFSNRSDSVVMELYFRTIKSHISFNLDPKYFMSDMAESFFNGWSAVYPLGRVKKLFCSWHVDRAWRQNLNKVLGKEMQIQTYKQIKVLMMERDTFSFNIMANNLLKQLFSHSDTKSFATYIEKFINDPHPWAYCHRINAGINTNMHLENIHKTIKYIFLQGRKVKRLDKGIHALMRFVRDKMFDRLITMHKDKLTRKLSDIRTRHKTSLDMGQELVEKISEGSWSVLSKQRKEMYTVSCTNSDCACNLQCDYCSACIHHYDCTCADASIKWNMCKHIHLVCRLYKEENNDHVNIPPALPLQPEQQVVSSTLQAGSVPEEEALTCQLSRQPRTSTDVKRLKLREELNEILQMVDDSEEKMDFFIKHIAPVKSILRSMESKRQTFDEDAEKSGPANKKICPQRQLISTKKKPSKKNP